jgi:transcriptional regulator with XRE-family HTH domain
MERDWTRLGRALAAARRAMDGRPTQQQLAEIVGVSRATVQAVERGKPFTKITPTLRAVERAVGWKEGSLESVLAGAEPAPARAGLRGGLFADPYAAAADRPVLAGGLPLRVVQELSEGEVLDTEVLDLTGPGSRCKMIVVLKRERDSGEIDAERLRAELAAWSRVQRRIRRIADYRPEEPA